MTTTPDMIVTTALTYANGPIHLGHMLEAIQADIWVRFQRMQNRNCLFLSGDDAHGTPIMLKAESLGISPEELINQIHTQHKQDYLDFGISFDHYSSTNNQTNNDMTLQIYQKLQENGFITTREIEQAYDAKCGMFLPDRYIKGECPKCHTPDQYGDACENCGATYNPTDLINAYSTLTNTKPTKRNTEHYFFKLNQQSTMLQNWLKNSDCQTSVTNKLKEWFEIGLKDWDISRDAPYFGFAIPNTNNEKYFYVWLDAPIGYIAATIEYGQQHNVDLLPLWQQNSNTQIYHFIGKDIMYFHGLFWPAVLDAAKMHTPSGLFSHGFLTINGDKMSKSRGTFITARQYLDEHNPEHLRYYLASKLGSSIEDIDLNLTDFVQKINSDLIGKVINIASRTARFIERDFQGKLAAKLTSDTIFQQSITTANTVADAYQTREFNKAVRLIMQLADSANQMIAESAPWQMLKEGKTNQAHQVCSESLLVFRNIIIMLTPIMPNLANQVATFFGQTQLTWQDIPQIWHEHPMQPFTHLMQRLDIQSVEKLSSYIAEPQN